jgi:photosystem II stability/assembly factor-like uncharacterized protein
VTKIVSLAASALLLAAQSHDPYACMIISKGYVVGMPVPLSGLARLEGAAWKHLGFRHPLIRALDYDPRDPRVLYLAAGNGCMRSPDRGASWRITTSWDMTELQDVSVDRNAPDHIYIGLPDGIGVSRDQGRTWQRADSGIDRKYTNALRVDRTQAGRVLAATERGLFLSENAGRSWRIVCPEAPMGMKLAQSPHDPKDWLAATQNRGGWRSRDGGLTWRRVAGLADGPTIYTLYFDPTRKGRLVAGSWGPGVLVSEDDGATWQARNRGLPTTEIWYATWDPDKSGRLWTNVHEKDVFVSDDAGLTWRSANMDGAVIYDLQFVPRGGAR